MNPLVLACNGPPVPASEWLVLLLVVVGLLLGALSVVVGPVLSVLAYEYKSTNLAAVAGAISAGHLFVVHLYAGTIPALFLTIGIGAIAISLAAAARTLGHTA